MGGQLQAREAVGYPTFYGRLEPFEDFAAVTDARHYVEAPDDWLVVVAEIKDFTDAARAGRYKMSTDRRRLHHRGAQRYPGVELPFTFGRDGATL